MKRYNKISLILLLSIPFLPSCFNKSEKPKDSSKVIITVDGKPAVTEQELEDFISQAVEANPQAKMMYTMMPEAIKEQALEAKKQQVLMSAWAKKEGVRESAEYKKKLAQVIDSIYNTLDQEEFIKRHKPDVTEQEIIEFYEQHKNEPQFLMNQPGVKAVGVEFPAKEDADKFAQEIAGKAADALKIAEGKKFATKDYGVVNSDAFAPKAIKSAVENVKSFPSVKVVKDDKKYVVVVALSKENAKIYPLEEVKEGIRRMLDGQKMQNVFESKMAEYEKSLKVNVDDSFKSGLKEQSERRQEEFRQKMEAAQPQAEAAAPAKKAAQKAQASNMA